MSQDYAKRAARHKQQMSPNKQTTISKGLLIFTLLLVAAFGSFRYFLSQMGPQKGNSNTEPAPQATTNDKTTAKAAATAAPPIEESAPESEYDFYKLLPEAEVIPPKVEEYLSEPREQREAKSYLLQAGSFRKYSDADRLRARLILEGLEVKLGSVPDKKGGIWHRVLVGPFQSRSKLNHAQDILARANTESMLIEIKSPQK